MDIILRFEKDSTLKNATPLASLVMPSLEVCSIENLYFRPTGPVFYSYIEKFFRIGKYASISFDTYFNAFSAGKWKSIALLESIEFSVDFEGFLFLQFYLHKDGSQARIVFEKIIESKFRYTDSLDLPFWPSITEGLIYAKFTSLSDSRIYNAYFSTFMPPKNEVRLGIVVTTFNRQQYVCHAIERLSRELFSDPAFAGLIDMTVVDNGRNLENPNCAGVTLIPNPNLGGAGGFTRGLMHLIDRKTPTHCLFMDDDATCEVEAIRRSFRILQYASNHETSVAGAMLLEERGNIQHECGASFKDALLIPLKNNINLSIMENVVANENPARIDYAAWWFCAFPISLVKSLAFPFFVRGDDFTFCIKNLGHIESMNGVATWQEGFENKRGPMIEYLSMRSIIASDLLLGSAPNGILRANDFIGHVFSNAAGYNYDRASFLCEAMQDVLAGPNFWQENADMVTKRARLKSLLFEEILSDCAEAAELPVFRWHSHRRKNTLLRVLEAAYFHFIPNFMMRKEAVCCDIRKAPYPEATYRRSRVLYYNERSRKGFFAVRSRQRFFEIGLNALILYIKFRWTFLDLRSSYKSSYDALTSREFWERWIHV